MTGTPRRPAALSASLLAHRGRAPRARAASALGDRRQGRPRAEHACSPVPDRPRPSPTSAVAVLVFPEVVKAGFGFGGQYGEGALRRDDATVGYYNLASASFGFQIGAQAYSEAYFFMTEDALGLARPQQRLRGRRRRQRRRRRPGLLRRRQLDDACTQPIVVFVFGQQGLMAGAIVEGSKISPHRPEVAAARRQGRPEPDTAAPRGLPRRRAIGHARRARWGGGLGRNGSRRGRRLRPDRRRPRRLPPRARARGADAGPQARGRPPPRRAAGGDARPAAAAARRLRRHPGRASHRLRPRRRRGLRRVRPNARGLSVANGKGVDPHRRTGLGGDGGDRALARRAAAAAAPLRRAGRPRRARRRPVPRPAAAPARAPRRPGPLTWAEAARSRHRTPRRSCRSTSCTPAGSPTCPTSPFYTSTNGLASGTHPVEAALHGALRTDRGTTASRSSRRLPPEARAARRIDPATVDDPAVAALLDRLAERGFALALWDATTDVGVAGLRSARSPTPRAAHAGGLRLRLPPRPAPSPRCGRSPRRRRPA